MKNSNLVVFLVLMILGNNVVAQENVIKIRPTTLFIGNINLSYERAMPNGTQSFALHTGFLIPRSLPNIIIQNDGIEDASLENRIGGFSIIPEYRFYVEGTVLEGFYVAPYLKFSNYFLNLEARYDDHDAIANGSFRTLGLGAAIGYQWVFGSGFTVDWTFVGLGINRNRLGIEFIGNDTGIDYDEWEDDIDNEFGGIPIVGNKIKFETGEDFIRFSAPYIGMGFRSMLTLGYAF